MKGVTVLQIMMIITVIVAGLFVILMGSVGQTPIYYHTLPEIQFSELLSSFTHTETNLKRTIEKDSDRFFSNIQENPIQWNKSWTSCSDFMDLFGKKLGNAASSYFGSVYVLEGAELNSSISESKVQYVPPNKLIWNYTYKIYLKRKMFGSEVANEINTTRNSKIEFNFLNLDKVYYCAKDFFNQMSTTKYKFKKLSPNKLETGLIQKLNTILENIDNCKSFDKSLKIPISCGGFDCDCNTMQPVTVILILSQKGNGTIAFSSQFNNFVCGELENYCKSGADCGTLDCVSNFCGHCYSSGPICSPSHSPETFGYRCYRIKSEKKEYKCLKNYDNIRVVLDGFERPEKWKKITLNCGKKHRILKIEGIPESNCFLEFNGVRIENCELDLCDTTKIPRTNGRLLIYAKSNSDEYALGGIDINFALSDCINKLNNEKFVYEFNKLNCNELRNNVKNEIDKKIKNTGIEGYSWNIEVDTKCYGNNPTSQFDEQYSKFKILFKEGNSVVATFQGIISYKPKT